MISASFILSDKAKSILEVCRTATWIIAAVLSGESYLLSLLAFCLSRGISKSIAMYGLMGSPFLMAFMNVVFKATLMAS